MPNKRSKVVYLIVSQATEQVIFPRVFGSEAAARATMLQFGSWMGNYQDIDGAIKVKSVYVEDTPEKARHRKH